MHTEGAVGGTAVSKTGTDGKADPADPAPFSEEGRPPEETGIEPVEWGAPKPESAENGPVRPSGASEEWLVAIGTKPFRPTTDSDP